MSDNGDERTGNPLDHLADAIVEHRAKAAAAAADRRPPYVYDPVADARRQEEERRQACQQIIAMLGAFREWATRHDLPPVVESPLNVDDHSNMPCFGLDMNSLITAKTWGPIESRDSRPQRPTVPGGWPAAYWTVLVRNRLRYSFRPGGSAKDYDRYDRVETWEPSHVLEVDLSQCPDREHPHYLRIDVTQDGRILVYQVWLNGYETVMSGLRHSVLDSGQSRYGVTELVEPADYGLALGPDWKYVWFRRKEIEARIAEIIGRSGLPYP